MEEEILDIKKGKKDDFQRFELTHWGGIGLLVMSFGSFLLLWDGGFIGGLFMVVGILTFITSVGTGPLISVGFGIVILGAIFKIQHWPYAGFIVPIGLIWISFGVFWHWVRPNPFADRWVVFVAGLLLLLRFLHNWFHLNFIPQHWETSIVWFFVLAAYFFRFSKKPTKKVEDYHKLIIVVVLASEYINPFFIWGWGDLFFGTLIVLLASWALIKMFWRYPDEPVSVEDPEITE